MHLLVVGTARIYNYLSLLCKLSSRIPKKYHYQGVNLQLDTLAQWSRRGTSNPEVCGGTEFKADCGRHKKGQKNPSGIWNRKTGQRNRKRKTGTKRNKHSVSKKSKEKRETEKKRGAERERERERIKSTFTHHVSTN